MRIPIQILQKKHRLDKILPVLSYLNDKVFLAGGALRTVFDKSDKLKDYDLFFTDLDYLPVIKVQLEADGWRNSFTCPYDKLFIYLKNGLKLQLICEKQYNSPQDCINSFDLTACMLVLDNNNLYVNRTTIRDIKRLRLQINTIEYPVATFNRIIKYRDKGYSLFSASRQFIEFIAANGSSNLDMRWYID